MNTQILLLLAAILLTAHSRTFGQASGATFTRITTGPVATDMAHSFGCAWGDYDNDGFLDLMVGNGLGDANALYRNDRKGNFTRVTNAVTTTVGDTDGVVWGDYDNDGDEDLFVANYQVASFLFRNDGSGNFTRIVDGTMGANVADSIGCAWGDYDNDGWLDLIVANMSGQNEYLYQNAGGGSFTQILTGPIPTHGINSSIPLWADYDNNGTLDLFITTATDAALHTFFRNDGQGAFTRLFTPPAGVSESGTGDWGDYDNDGDLDLYLSQHGPGSGGANDLLYRNDGSGTFTRITSGPIPTSGGSTTYGAAWGDYDNDGWLDLYANNRHGQQNFLFHNDGDGNFTRITSGELINDTGENSGCVWVDYDNDGFLDLFFARGAEAGAAASRLYHNDGNSNRWLSVLCAGRISNRSGIGAKVRVKATIGGADRWQLRDISSGGGYGGCRPRAHFGLGDATNAEMVRIEWPSGLVQELRNVVANQILTVKEPPVLAFIKKEEGADGKVSVATLSLQGGQGISYAVERSTNLIHWDYLTNVVATNIETIFTDGPRLSDVLRFYRAREDD